jgi:DNA-binding transcriptional ArsR family regulator
MAESREERNSDIVIGRLVSGCMPPSFKGTEKVMLYTLLWLMETGKATSRGNLSKHTGFGVGAVGLTLKTLEQLGIITKNQHRDDRNRAWHANTYDVNLEYVLSRCISEAESEARYALDGGE